MKNITVSVIVPVYNVEKYIHECIDSILAQTFQNFEIILVDDGSTDSSSNICDEYATKDSRIKVFHKENGGVASARNIGIESAVGEWIMFIDSDDTIKPNMMEVLYNTVIESKCDAAMSRTYRFNDRGIVTISHPDIKECILSKEQIVQILFGEGEKNKKIIRGCGFTTLIYKAKILKDHGIQFPALKIGEDWFFLIEFLINCNSVYICNKEFYGYRENPSSVSSNYVPNYLQDAFARREYYNNLALKYDHKGEWKNRLKHSYANKFYETTIMTTKNPAIKRGEITFGEFQRQYMECYVELKPYLQILSTKKRFKIFFSRLIASSKVLFQLYKIYLAQ